MPPDLPAPEDLPTVAEVFGDSTVLDAECWANGRNFDIRHSPSPVYVSADGERTRRQALWLEACGRLRDDPNTPAAASMSS
ncbi:hypothetical protein [Rhodococcus sp. IEGM 1330]|uniref:hypothetical protein n=1 Tax=Rhodococcus sp. IEGM 1330 TaxID=3082225 RepID=UPI002953F194|nr:hypothetical protein [Rhodococcus sp. IEGM 1330]MDV8025321.1 hypothetical protein [Rhodococcus sp. IEGM 1330]